jgi:hypothetical protein
MNTMGGTLNAQVAEGGGSTLGCLSMLLRLLTQALTIQI